MKQMHLALIIGLCALAMIALMVLLQRGGGPTFPHPSDMQHSASVESEPEEPPLPPPPSLSEQPEEPTPFNGQEASIVGSITSIIGNRIAIDVIEQPKDKPGLVTVAYEVQVNAQTDYSLVPAQAGGAFTLATKANLAVGDSVQVFVADATALQAKPIIASRIEIRKIQQ